MSLGGSETAVVSAAGVEPSNCSISKSDCLGGPVGISVWVGLLAALCDVAQVVCAVDNLVGRAREPKHRAQAAVTEDAVSCLVHIPTGDPVLAAGVSVAVHAGHHKHAAVNVSA